MPDPFDAEVGHRLRARRLAQELTQDQVAAALGVPRSAVSMIESGSRSLASSELAQLSRVFRWSAQELLFGGESQDAEPAQEEEQSRPPLVVFFRRQASLRPIEESWLAAAETQ